MEKSEDFIFEHNQLAPEYLNEFDTISNTLQGSKDNIKEINLKEPEEIKAARKFLKNSDDEKTGLSPVELHRRAMEKLSKENNKDFLEGDGQITFEF